MKKFRPTQIAALKLLAAGVLLVAAAVNFARHGWATEPVHPDFGPRVTGGIRLARLGPPVPPPPPPTPRMPAGQPVPVSPALEKDLTTIRQALTESLNGSEPLREQHARTFANWVSNLMLDVAYQNALIQGALQDPVLAEGQVRQALSKKP